MNIKLSRISLAFTVSVSFSTLANNVVSGSEVIADADIVVNAKSYVSLTITPIEGLTITDIKKGKQTKVATLNLIGNNLAVRMINPNSDYPYCTIAVGTNNRNNTAAFCLGGDMSHSFVDNGNTYYPVSPGVNYLRSGQYNAIGKSKVGVDTYKVSMELVEYTL
ncbi:hypothetical protein ACPD0F_003651 [Vibrio cholerae]|nr:hypothetical protein [Vibrio cholerae]EJL6770156.1 hypothetical protein [Vibrio cholerae]